MIKEKLKRIYHSTRVNSKLLRDRLFGKRGYKKFIIICDARTGSTLLLNHLGFHPQIEVEGEMYKNIRNHTHEEIWRRIFRKRNRNIRYVGFKLFYSHGQEEDGWVWKKILNHSDITIIHLTRKNALRSLVSKKIGLKTKRWTENLHGNDSIPVHDKRIYLDIQESLAYLKKMKDYRETIPSKFSNHEVYQVEYEELSENTRSVVNDFYSKFNLEAFYRQSKLKKQNPELLSDLVLNYEELKLALKGTEWESSLE